MSSLDDKLREIDLGITNRVTNDPPGVEGTLIEQRLKLTDEAIARIKQAFAEESWVDPLIVLQAALGEAPVPTQDRYGIDKDGKIFGPTKELMLGQEWYDRFEKNLLNIQPDFLLKNPALEVAIVAAQRASRVSND